MSEKWTRRKTVLITGGSKGIGLALAGEFARNGYDILLVGREEAALDRAASKLMTKYPVNVSTYALDLSKSKAPEELFRYAQETGLEVEVLVNNAGTGDYGPFSESDIARQVSMLNLNIVNLISLTNLFLKPMIERGKGRILNLASLVAYFSGAPGMATYVASKAFVLTFTRGLALELRGTGVTITALSPGATAADFVNSAGVGNTRVYRWLPKLSTRQVAQAGYRATMKGQTTIVPGLVNKILAFLGELHPRVIAKTSLAFLFAESISSRK